MTEMEQFKIPSKIAEFHMSDSQRERLYPDTPTEEKVKTKTEKVELQHIQELKRIVQEASLIPEAEIQHIYSLDFDEIPDAMEEQKKMLENKKKDIANLINALIGSATNYTQIVSQANDISKRMQQEDLAQKYNEIDQRRRRAHEALLSNIRALNRNIRTTFSTLPEEILNKWRDEEQNKGNMLLETIRKDMAENVVCANTVNLNDRHSVAEWAFRITKELAQ